MKHKIEFTTEEIKVLAQIVDQVPVKGVASMAMILSIANKIQSALQVNGKAEDLLPPKEGEDL